jgi:cellulose synthase/poly-beta-1,6-N-acetylglucosamine synthase-like glycosyltransferase
MGTYINVMGILFLSLFLLTAFLCIASYILYPFIIGIIGYIRPFKVKGSEIEPFVSIIIPAYNESKYIEEKIHNTLALDYPKDKLDILVGSDGSQDETSHIVKRYEANGIKLFDFKMNRGKTAVQNDLVKHSSGEILVFTDAASFLPPNALRKLVRSFADERIGCVAGKLRYVNTGRNMTTHSQGLYWRYEVKLRELESRLGRLIGVDGPLYAVRRENYIPLGPQIISDLMTPLLVLEHGKRVVLEPEALVDEDPTINTGHEFKTRRRIALRGLVGLNTHKSLLNGFKSPLLTLQLLFHKVLRWLIGLLILLNLVSCVALSGFWFFKTMLVLYSLLFSAAVLGYISERLGFAFKFFSVPYYFVLVNSAATIGVVDFMRKKQVVSWQPIRNSGRSAD